jgi:trigger factor
MQQQLKAPLFEDKVVDFIFELIQISDKDVKKSDLEKSLEKLEEKTK